MLDLCFREKAGSTHQPEARRPPDLGSQQTGFHRKTCLQEGMPNLQLKRDSLNLGKRDIIAARGNTHLKRDPRMHLTTGVAVNQESLHQKRHVSVGTRKGSVFTQSLRLLDCGARGPNGEDSPFIPAALPASPPPRHMELPSSLGNKIKRAPNSLFGVTLESGRAGGSQRAGEARPRTRPGLGSVGGRVPGTGVGGAESTRRVSATLPRDSLGIEVPVAHVTDAARDLPLLCLGAWEGSKGFIFGTNNHARVLPRGQGPFRYC